MKFNVEVEIDWIHEDLKVDDAVSEQIQNKIVNKVLKTIEKQVADKVSCTIGEVLDKKIMDTYDEFLSKDFTVYDKWGDVVKDKVNVKEILKEKFENFMLEKVDKDGKASSYNGTYRYKQILDEQAQKQINSFMSALSRTVIEGIKKDINDEAVRKISESILSDYSLKKLINPIA